MRLVAPLAPLVFALSLDAGWAIDEVTTYAGGDKFYSRIAMDSGRYKNQTAGETLIIDLKKETVYFLNDKEKRYFGGKLNDVIADLRKNAMSEMNEEEDLFPAAEETEEKPVEIKRVKESFSVGGFTGEKYQILENGELKKELFIARTLTANSEIDPKKLSEIMLWLNGTSAPSSKTRVELSDEYVKLMKQGYPIRTVEYDPGGGLILTTVIKAEKKTIAPEEFALPKDYAKIDSSEIYKPLE
ncbi:MAG: DUF4412 domain-containing protein [Helicobacteraceae bacterium]|nr:DUF4412 domain-containing protein [Helicobacteraceae bacterium]